MPPVGDDPVARRRRAAAAATSSAAAFATSARAPSSPRWRRRPAAAAPPRRPEPVAPLTDAAIAAAPNRISEKWNRRRRPVAAPAGRAVDLARASHRIKRRNAPPKPLVFQCRLLAMTRWLAGAARPQQQHHQQQRSPRAPELHRRPDGDVGHAAAAPPRRPRRSLRGRRSERRGPEPNFEKHAIGGSVSARAGALSPSSPRSSAKRRNAPPKPLVFQCRLLAMTPWLAGAARPQQQHHQQQRSPRALELHRRPDGDVGHLNRWSFNAACWR